MSWPDELSRPATRRHAPGFTLLEVLVALIVFALVFGILAQILRTGLRQSATAETTATATLLARSQLARVGTELPIEAGEIEGEADGMRWRTAIELVRSASEETDLAAYRVRVTVAWGDDQAPQEVTLTTIRIGPAP
jgi:general secretion pathway protein I